LRANNCAVTDLPGRPLRLFLPNPRHLYKMEHIDRTHLVYCLFCSLCGHFYIGQTTRKLSTRFKDHLTDLLRGDKTNAMSKHYLESHHWDIHSPDWLRLPSCCTLRYVRDTRTLDLVESAYIQASLRKKMPITNIYPGPISGPIVDNLVDRWLLSPPQFTLTDRPLYATLAGNQLVLGHMSDTHVTNSFRVDAIPTPERVVPIDASAPNGPFFPDATGNICPARGSRTDRHVAIRSYNLRNRLVNGPPSPGEPFALGELPTTLNSAAVTPCRTRSMVSPPSHISPPSPQSAGDNVIFGLMPPPKVNFNSEMFTECKRFSLRLSSYPFYRRGLKPKDFGISLS
jgi:hypothetical protein